MADPRTQIPEMLYVSDNDKLKPVLTPEKQPSASKDSGKPVTPPPKIVLTPEKQPPPLNNAGKVATPLSKDVSPPPGTYVVQVPKDQILRCPPPGYYLRYKSHRNRRHRPCICYFLFILIIALGIAAAIFFFVFRKSPEYTISGIGIKNFNVTSPSPISPEFDVIIRAENPNDNIKIFYKKGSSVTVLYSDVTLSSGELMSFYQPTNNVTVLQTPLKGSDIMLNNVVKRTIKKEQKKGKIPFKVNVKAPVKFKVGAFKMWRMIIKVKCDIMVNALVEKSEIVSKDCRYRLRPW